MQTSMHLLLMGLGSSFRTFGIYNLGQYKMEQLSPFWHQWNGGRGGPGVPFIVSKIVVFLVWFNAWLLSFGGKNYEETALNEEIPVHEWQQKAKDVMKEFNSGKDVNVYFKCLKKPR